MAGKAHRAHKTNPPITTTGRKGSSRGWAPLTEQQSNGSGNVTGSGSDSDDTIVVDPEEEEEDAWARQQAEHSYMLPSISGARGSASIRWTDAQVNNFLLSRTLAPTDVLKPSELVRPVMGNVGRTAELIWILRPVFYGECDDLLHL